MTGYDHNRNLRGMRLSALLLCMLAPALALGDVRLLHSIDTRALGVKQPAGLYLQDADHAALADRADGRLLPIDASGTAAKVIAAQTLSGKGLAFKSRELQALQRLDDGRWSVLNSGDASVVLLDGAGHLLQTFGADEPGALRSPVALAASGNGRFYVADTGGNRVMVYGRDGTYLHSIGDDTALKDQRLSHPTDLAIDASETLYVLDGDGRLSIFGPTGALLKQIDFKLPAAGQSRPMNISAMTADPNGVVYLADNVSGKLLQYDWHTQAVLYSFGSRGGGTGQFAGVAALSARVDGTLGVLDPGNHKLEIYQLEVSATRLAPVRVPTVAFGGAQPAVCDALKVNQRGERFCLSKKLKKLTLTDAAGAEHELVTALKGPRDITVSADYVVLFQDGGLRVYGRDGKLRAELKGAGRQEGALNGASGAAVAAERLYVADTGNNRIQMYTLDGVFLKAVGGDKEGSLALKAPGAMAADARGNVYVADSGTHTVKVFNRELQFQYELGQESPALTDIHDLTVDGDGYLYVLGATQESRFGLRVYSGRQPYLAFGGAGSSGAGMQNAAHVSASSAGKTQVWVHDGKRAALLQFQLQGIPATVLGLHVTGMRAGTGLRWQPAPERFVTSYKVYAWNEGSAARNLVATVSEANAKLGAEQATADYYAVTAVSGYGVESELSQPQQDYFVRGNREYQQSHWETAVQWFGKALQDSPDNADALELLGRSQLALGRTDEALTRFQTLASIDGRGDVAGELMAEALLKAARPLDARVLIDRMLARNPAGTRPYWLCVEVNQQIKDPNAAVVCLQEILKRDTDSVPATLALAKGYIDAGAPNLGIAPLEAAWARNASNAALATALGDLYLAAARNEDAFARYNQALTRDPTSAAARLGAARAQLARGELDEARLLALALAGDAQLGTEGTLLLGQIAIAAKRYDEALLAFNRVLRESAREPRALVGLADVYRAQNQPAEELKNLQLANEADATRVDVLQRLAGHDSAAGRWTEAVDFLRRAADREPRNGALLHELAVAELKALQLQEARRHVQAALALQPEQVDWLVTQAEIAQAQGKLVDAIASINRAMSLQPGSPDLTLKLAALYVDSFQFEQAQPLVETASALHPNWDAAYALNAKVYAGRQLYPKAQAAAEKAVQLNPSEANKTLLSTLLGERKRTAEWQAGAARLVLEDLKLKPMFSAAYKQYAKESIGSIRLRNTGTVALQRLQLRFLIKGYMDFPYTSDVASLGPGAALEVPLYAPLSNKVLEVDEDTGVQVSIAVGLNSETSTDAVSLTTSTTLYGKNAMLWRDAAMIGAFVTPRDDMLRDFVRQSATALPENTPVNAALLNAMGWFAALSAHGLHYTPDPNLPYSRLSQDQVDYVQFPRETLRLKSGDCDDLSVLLAAGLENLGIETALVEVPGHLFLAFNTGLPIAQRQEISTDADLVVEVNGKAWIPVEATLLAASFSEAWAEGARKFRDSQDKKSLQLLMLRDTWQSHAPATLAPAQYVVALPGTAAIRTLVQREYSLLLDKSLERQIEPYRALIAQGIDTQHAQLQIGIQYAKSGLYERALGEFERLVQAAPEYSAAAVAMGNAYYLNKSYAQALDAYTLAERLAPDDAGIKLDLALSLYAQQNSSAASGKFHEAATLDAELARRYETFGKLLAN